MPVAAMPTSLDVLCLAIKALLIARGGFAANLVFYSDEVQSFPASGYPFFAISQGAYSLDEGTYQGGGRFDTWIVGTVVVSVIYRAAKDQAERNEILLHGNPGAIPPVLGLNAYDHKVLNALHGIFVPDASGNFLTIEPLKFQGSSRPMPYKGNPEWTAVEMSFRAMYMALLDLPE